MIEPVEAIFDLLKNVQDTLVKKKGQNNQRKRLLIFIEASSKVTHSSKDPLSKNSSVDGFYGNPISSGVQLPKWPTYLVPRGGSYLATECEDYFGEFQTGQQTCERFLKPP